MTKKREITKVIKDDTGKIIGGILEGNTTITKTKKLVEMADKDLIAAVPVHPKKIDPYVVLTDFLLQFFTSAFLYQTTVLQSRLKYNVYLHFNHTGQV
ncbi:MAG: hypothetical protein D3903_21905 [Candidatus Electrothrix sp. GM3_4]|nr:hypothetical protein [Candidatus Electrothrix sp. GM3_4]